MLVKVSASVLVVAVLVGVVSFLSPLSTLNLSVDTSFVELLVQNVWLLVGVTLFLACLSGIAFFLLQKLRDAEEDDEDFEDELDRMIREQKEKQENRRPMLSRTVSIDEIIVAGSTPLGFDIPDELLREYPFFEPDTEDNTEYDEESGKRQLVGGTFLKLVEKLTHHSKQDPHYVRAFLLTYRSFSSPKELLDTLEKRWNLPKADMLDDAARVKYESIQRQIRLRIWYVVKEWMDHFFEFDFKGDDELISSFSQFITMDMASVLTGPAKQLEVALNRKIQGNDTRKIIQPKTPSPIVPRCKGELTVMDIHPLEMARQLFMIEHELYRKIQPKECLDQSWTKNDAQGKTVAPNVLALINRFNQMSKWVITLVVQERNMKQRIRLVNHLIQIALECKKMGNFNGMMEVVSGLLNAPVSRLKKTWAGLPKRSQKQFKKFEYIMARNYKLLRDYIQYSNPPVLPYIGIYLGDLTFIHEGNADLTSRGLINFYKKNLISKVIKQIQQHQQKPVCFELVDSIQSFLNSPPRLLDDNEAYKLSLEIEPRQSSS